MTGSPPFWYKRRVDAPAPPDLPRRPTAPRDRAVTVDALRGVAVLGILLINIRSFALPGDGQNFLVHAATTADRLAYAATSVLAQGKFITIFSALYGAGILLSTRRADAEGRPAFGTFLRRSLVLAGVGLGHMLLFWPGDVLLLYAVAGLIAFSMRRLTVGWLWASAGIGYGVTVGLLLLFSAAFWAFGALGADEFPDKTPAERVEASMFDPAENAAEVEAVLSGFAGRAARQAGETLAGQAAILFVFGPATLGLMLAGMALLRSGFLTGEWPARRYAAVAAAGLIVGLAGSAAATWAGWRSDFTPIYWAGLGTTLLQTLAPIASLGIAAAVILLARGGGAVVTDFSRVGRMAFTNYLSQTLLCTFVFHGWGLGYFGQIGFARQLWVVLAVWIVQIIWSVLWLSRFRYGPLEWLWRWATYGRRPALLSSRHVQPASR